MTQEALKLALEALDKYGFAPCDKEEDWQGFKRAITAIKEALAQLEQEEKLPPVEIGVDVTDIGTTVVAFYRRPNAVMEMFYSQFHPLAQPEQEPVAWMHIMDNTEGIKANGAEIPEIKRPESVLEALEESRKSSVPMPDHIRAKLAALRGRT